MCEDFIMISLIFAFLQHFKATHRLDICVLTDIKSVSKSAYSAEQKYTILKTSFPYIVVLYQCSLTQIIRLQVEIKREIVQQILSLVSMATAYFA